MKPKTVNQNLRSKYEENPLNDKETPEVEVPDMTMTYEDEQDLG